MSSDAKAIAAFIQGGLAMMCMTGVNGGLAVAKVEQWRDGDGNYLPWFDVVTDSGIRVRVTVDPDPAPPPGLSKD